MGFFDFFKKKEPAKADELDVPPAPPMDFGMDAPDAPSSPDDGQFDFSMPDIPPGPQDAESYPTYSPSQRGMPALQQEEQQAPQKAESRITYLSLHRFRQMVEDFNTIRGDLKKMDHVLAELHNTTEHRERDLDRYRTVLNDTNRKLMAMDKILFSGER